MTKKHVNLDEMGQQEEQRQSVVKKYKKPGRPKGVKKVVFTSSLDKDLKEEFEGYCEEQALNKSKLLERMIREYMENVKK